MTHSFTPNTESPITEATPPSRRWSALCALAFGLSLCGTGLLASSAVEASELTSAPKSEASATLTTTGSTAPADALATGTSHSKSKSSTSKSKSKRKAKKKVQEPEVSYGPFDTAAVKAALDEAAVASQACAVDEQKGEAHLRILLTNTGVVQRLNVTKHDCSEPVAECVLQRFQGLRVPPYDGKQRAVTTKVTLL